MAQPAPQSGTTPSQDIPQPAPYSSNFVEANGLKLHYLDYGTAGKRPMLCVHGSAAHAHWFDFVASGFTSDHHVRAIDLRGNGDSEWADPPKYFYDDYASDIAAVAEKLDLRDFVLIGHSMGGAIALEYAATYPGRVQKLVIVDSTINLSAERIAEMRGVGSRPGSSYATLDELAARYRLRPGHSFAVPEVLRYIGKHGARQDADGSWRYKFDRKVYGTRQTYDGRPNWNKIEIPALLVKGDHSHRISPEVFADVKTRCPQAELVEVANSDHHVTLDNPAGFIAAVKPFLAKRP